MGGNLLIQDMEDWHIEHDRMRMTVNNNQSQGSVWTEDQTQQDNTYCIGFLFGS